MPTTAPEAIEQYALRVAEQWKLGRRTSTTVLFWSSPKHGADFASRSAGLEGALNDATCPAHHR